MELRRADCGFLPMSLWKLGLITLTLLVFCSQCSTQDSYLSHCDDRGQPQFIGNCAGASVIRVSQVYTGTGINCTLPLGNRTTCVELTERLRMKCNILHSCTPSARIPQRCGGNISITEYECIPTVNGRLAALINSSRPISGSAMWLLTATHLHVPEGDDVYRQMCRVGADGPRNISLDFLDLSYHGNVPQGGLYCVYWGELDFMCARKASERQKFQVHISSNSQNTQLTLLFWSKNYTKTTTARFWIEIRAAAESISVECGLSVLDYPSIATPEPYWLPTTPANPTTPKNPTSHVTRETVTEGALGSEHVTDPQSSTDNTFIVAVVSSVLVAVFLLVILIAVLYVCVYRRKQSDDVPVGISEMTTSQGDNIHRVDNVYMISPGDEAAAADSMNMRNRDGRSGSNFTNVYDAVDAPQEQPNSPDPPQPTGPLYSQVVNRRQPMADIAVSSSGLYDHIQSRDGSALAIPSPENLDEPPTAPETSSMAVYSQVNKAKKRTSPHSALNGNEGAETFVNSIYEPTGSGANDTGELDLMENDLYETSEAITNSK